MQLFMRMGIPRVITTDQGKEFNNTLNKKLMEKLHIKHRLTTAYHPQVRMINIILSCSYVHMYEESTTPYNTL